MLIGIERRTLYDSGIAVYRCVNSAIIGFKRFICNIPTAVTTLYLEIDLYGIGSVGVTANAAIDIIESTIIKLIINAINLFVFIFFSFFCLHGNCRIGVACA